MLAVAIGVVLAGPTFTGTASALSAVPTITSPVDGATVCVYPQEGIAVYGVEPGALNTTIQLYDNGMPVDSTNEIGDGGVWLTFLSYPALGAHALAATAVDMTGESAPSPTVHITVAPGHPLSASTSVDRFSPKNQDGVNDSVDISMSSDASGTVDVAITKADATMAVVRHAHLQVVAGQGLDWIWDGKDDGGNYVPDGAYTAVLTWNEDGCQSQNSELDLTVDNTAPRIHRLTAGPGTFYPRPDFGREIGDGISLGAIVTWEQADQSTPVFTFSLYHAGAAKPFRTFKPGDSFFTWYGRSPAGALMPAGRYAYQLRATDGVGNTSISPRKSFVLSYKRMVKRTTTALGSGKSFTVKDQHNSCGMTTSQQDSRYPGGLLLRYCGKKNRDVSVLVYAMRAPRMNKLFSFEPILTGGSPDHNRMAGLLLTFHPKRWFGFRIPAAYGTHEWRLPGYQFVSDDGHIYFAVGFAGPGNYDYDIKNLGAKYTYEVFTAK
jgi:flagellar hook assembly protein FlgD